MTHTADSMAARLAAVRARLRGAEQRAGRPTGAVHLLAVSKHQPVSALRAAALAGQTCFGESYLQEAQEKIAALQDLALQWHFIGPLQSNKTRPIATGFDWVHSVDRGKIARRLAAQRPPQLPALNVCLQVNISGEAGKSGATPEQVPALAREIAALPRLTLRGLMAIPEKSEQYDAQLATFMKVRALYDQLNHAGYGLDTLSMGMSNDLEAAVMAGSTLVRIGTALFGTRDPDR